MSETEPKTEAKTEANDKRLPTDRHRLMRGLDELLVRKPVQVALAGAMVALTALLVGPSLGKSDSLLKTLKAKEPAPKSIKALRAFVVPQSEEALQQRRAAATAAVLPVFDHQADRGAILLSRIHRAFEAVSAAERPAAANDGAAPAKPAPPPTEEEQRLRFSEALQVKVPADVFEPLHATGFSPDVRAALVLLAGSVMEKMVIAHRSALRPFKGRPIVIRRLLGPTARGEEQLEGFDRIQDLEQVREDIRHQANVHGAKLPAKVRKSLVRVVDALVVANVNMTFNQEETEARKNAARSAIRDEPRPFAKGEVIIPDGAMVTVEHLRIIERMESAYRGVTRVQVTLIGFALLVTALLWVVNRFAAQHFRGLALRPRDLVAMGVLALALMALMRGAIIVGGDATRADLWVVPYLLPIAAGPMLVRLLISAEAAALFAVILGSLGGLMVERTSGGDLGLMLYYLVTSLVGAGAMAQVQSRSAMLRAGGLAGLIGALTAICLALVGGHLEVGKLLYVALAALGGGICAAFVTLALLPAVEWLFAYTTDVTLLELANLNHPLMRDMMIQAPGTYHHSMVVGSLSEAACEAIGANPLLAHVAANFHDVGKVKNGLYFAENFKGGENPHNRLKPSMSALIIRNHLKHTLEMLREHAVPEPVIEIATQHHGTTLMEFFFHKAKKELEDQDQEDVHEEDYRYPGPKPQTREAGVLMLADGVEAAARSLAEPTEDRLRSVVQRVINAKFTDGQLDHCDLTLRDLHLIAKAFLHVLRGIYHQRPTYPWQQREREREREAGRERDQTQRRKPNEELPANGQEKEREKDKTPAKAEGKRQEKPGEGKRQEKPGEGKRQESQDAKQDPRRERERERDVTGPKAPVKSKRGEPGKRGGKANEDRSDAAQGEPEGGGGGEEPAEPRSPDEAPTESSPDLKRLGLN